MEQPLKCISQMTLKEMIVRWIVVRFWNSSEILDFIAKFRMQAGSLKNWKDIEHKIEDRILKLGLPKLLTQQMLDVVRPIGKGIEKWKRYNEYNFRFMWFKIYEHELPKLYFTPAGTIHTRRTAEELVKFVRLTVKQRYQIASSYWLEEYIPSLWEELSEADKKYFSKQNPTFQGLQFSWPRIYQGREPYLDTYLRNTHRNLTSFKQWAFEHSVKISCKATAEYFFQKLGHDEREASLMRCAHTAFFDKSRSLNARFYEVFCYLLSLMTPTQQMEIVKACPLGVLSCFLHWPQRDLFFENAGLIWPFIPPRVYDDLLQRVIITFDKNYFPGFFPSFFKQSPPAFQVHFVHEDSGASKFLSMFFDYEDPEAIKVVFRTVDAVDRVKIVFLHNTLMVFYSGMLTDNWPLVELCLQEAMLSREDKKRLKETYIEYLRKGFSPLNIKQILLAGPDALSKALNDKDPKFQSFYDFLDGNDAIADTEMNVQEH